MYKKTLFGFLKIVIIFQFIANFSLIFLIIKKNPPDNPENNEYHGFYENIEEIDLNISIPYIEIEEDDRKFLNGLIRTFKPKKLLEIGVSAGGSSSLILYAIKDIPNSKLFSIDRINEWYKNSSKKVGWVVKKYFPKLADKWTLFSGRNPSEFLKLIGKNIDFVFIDTIHKTPGEMLNWLEVLPFLKEEAIVVFHDVFLMFYHNNIKINENYSNNQLFCYIRGKLILPSKAENLFSRNIGAIKLDREQKKYFKQYFIALGNLWHYFPREKDLKIFRKHFKKYYGEKYVDIFDDAVQKNRMRFTK